MSGHRPRLVPLGDSAITIELGTGVDPALCRQVRGTADRIRTAQLAGVLEVVPAYAALTVYYDPLEREFDVLIAELGPLVTSGTSPGTGSDFGLATTSEPREFRFAVRYDGPDLEDVARAAGLTASEVIERHSRPWYEAYLVGFAPGFAYLGTVDPSLVLPRRSAPRTRVPAGAVGIGGAQTAVYPLEMPGGWHLLGHTDSVLFDPERSPPSLLRVGDRVRFEAIVA